MKDLIKACEREIRDIVAKAQSIEDAAFDLKAVNPNAKTEEDTRTPADLIEIIRQKSRELQSILDRLEQLSRTAEDELPEHFTSRGKCGMA